MIVKPKDRFKLKQRENDSIFNGLELIVQNNGPHTMEVSVEGDTILIRAIKEERHGNA